MKQEKLSTNLGLVFPKYVNRGEIYDFYFGLSIISSCLKQAGYNVFCLNPNHYYTPIETQLSQFINNNDIDILCTGGMSVHYNEINEVLKISKDIKPNIITIVGGAIVTSNPKVTCWGIGNIDYGVIGEGEETIIELADAIINKKDPSSIKGLAYFNNKKEYIITEERIPLKNLDVIPLSDYEGFEYKEYMKLFNPSENHFFSVMDEVRVGYIMASRSCPFACTFCYHHPNSKYRQRSLDNVFLEIEYLIYKYDINFLNIVDELFSFDKKRMYEFAERIKKYNLKWWTNFRVSDVDAEVLKTLKDSGLFMMSYGIESINEKILKSMKKHITRAQIENALKLTHDAKINIQGNIILGDPEDTEETIKESIDFVESHPEYGINLVMIRTYPFAAIYKYAISKGLIKDEFKHMTDGFPLVNLTKISDQKYQEISTYVENYGEELNHFLYGKVWASFRENNDTFSLQIKCPSCNNISEYKNMTQKSFRTYFKLICRNCNVHLQVENLQAYAQNYTLKSKITSTIIKYLKQNINSNYIINKMYCILKDLKHRKLIRVSEKYV